MNDNSTKYPPPESGNSGPPESANGGHGPEGPTDFESLMSQPAPVEMPAHPEARAASRSGKAEERTDFASLAVGQEFGPKRRPPRTPVDWLLDSLVPIMIFVMVISVIYFLLDWRFIRSAYMHGNIKFVATCFIVGIVALNRLIAREGSDESIIYIGGLGVTVALYTFGLTVLYPPEGRSGSIVPSILDHPFWATALNCTIVGFVWWVTNRLMHECCVDDNPTAGEVGILTGTAMRLRKAMKREPKQKPVESTTLDAIDPTQWVKPKPKAAPAPLAAAQRLSKRHPGISIFYFSVPVMLIFAAGLKWTQHGGDIMILTGHFYVGCYTVAALSLLMLTSLGGLRNYFRSRHVEVPAGIGPFWVGLGLVFIAMVLLGAAGLPLPGLPGIAYVAEHEIDPWVRGSTFEVQPIAATPAKMIHDSRIVQHLSIGVLACLGLFLAYGALRAAGAFAFRIARQRDRYPQWVVRLFDRIDRFLMAIAKMPKLPKFKPPPRVRPEVATSTKFRNPLSSAAAASWTPTDQIEYAYDALCALALDLGVPRRADQTPHEFIHSFPKLLDNVKEEAQELTDLLVEASYAGKTFDRGVHDRLRKFWISYERLKGMTVR